MALLLRQFVLTSGVLLPILFPLVVFAKVYKRCELARELRYVHGISMSQLATWVCIAQHESNFDTAAKNPGSGDHGLFQISEVYWCSATGVGNYPCGSSCSVFEDDDIGDDVACSKKIFDEHQRISGDGFSAWVAYSNFCRDSPRLPLYISGCFDEENVVSYEEPAFYNEIINPFDDAYRDNEVTTVNPENSYTSVYDNPNLEFLKIAAFAHRDLAFPWQRPAPAFFSASERTTAKTEDNQVKGQGKQVGGYPSKFPQAKGDSEATRYEFIGHDSRYDRNRQHSTLAAITTRNFAPFHSYSSTQNPFNNLKPSSTSSFFKNNGISFRTRNGKEFKSSESEDVSPSPSFEAAKTFHRLHHGHHGHFHRPFKFKHRFTTSVVPAASVTSTSVVNVAESTLLNPSTSSRTTTASNTDVATTPSTITTTNTTPSTTSTTTTTTTTPSTTSTTTTTTTTPSTTSTTTTTTTTPSTTSTITTTTTARIITTASSTIITTSVATSEPSIMDTTVRQETTNTTNRVHPMHPIRLKPHTGHHKFHPHNIHGESGEIKGRAFQPLVKDIKSNLQLRGSELVLSSTTVKVPITKTPQRTFFIKPGTVFATVNEGGYLFSLTSNGFKYRKASSK